MTYQIDRYSNNSLDPSAGFPIIIPDKTVNVTNTSLKLLGRGITNFGEIVAENFVHLLENFAGDIQPVNAISGQNWYDSNSDRLRLYTSTGWQDTSGPNLVSDFPDQAISYNRDLIFLQSNGVSGLYVNNGVEWNAISTVSRSTSNLPPTVPSTDAILGQLHYNENTGKFLIRAEDNPTSGTPILKKWRILGPTHFVQQIYPDDTNPDYAQTPEKPQIGDLWSDITNTNNIQLKVYDGSSWSAVVPTTTNANIRNIITQTSHGFSKGSALYFNTSINRYALARSNDPETLGIFVVSNVISDNSFELCLTGYITGLTGLTPGYMYVSDNTPGLLTTSPGAYYNNCIFMADSTTSGYVLPWRAFAI